MTDKGDFQLNLKHWKFEKNGNYLTKLTRMYRILCKNFGIMNILKEYSLLFI